MQHRTSHPTNGSRQPRRFGLQAMDRSLMDRHTAVRLLGLFAFALVVLLLPGEAVAGTGGVDLPWNTPLQNLLDNMTGSTARILAGLMLVVGGIVWGFTRNEEGAKRFGQGIVAIALMFGAVQIVDALAFAGGVI